MRLFFAGIAAATIMLSSSVFAQTGAAGYFTIHNVTDSHTVNNFYTSENGTDWSDSWLDSSTILEPGDSMDVEFIADSGSCLQYITVAWMGANGSEVEDDPFSINICEASNVYLGDNEITFD